jgi:hypothetical protein
MEINKIAEVRSKYKEPVGPDEMRKTKSVIEVEAEYAAGLDKIENYEYQDQKFFDQQLKENLNRILLQLLLKLLLQLILFFLNVHRAVSIYPVSGDDGAELYLPAD